MSKLSIHTNLYQRENKLQCDFNAREIVTITWVDKKYIKDLSMRIVIAAIVQTAICLMTNGLTGNEREFQMLLK